MATCPWRPLSSFPCLFAGSVGAVWTISGEGWEKPSDFPPGPPGSSLGLGGRVHHRRVDSLGTFLLGSRTPLSGHPTRAHPNPASLPPSGPPWPSHGHCSWPSHTGAQLKTWGPLGAPAIRSSILATSKATRDTTDPMSWPSFLQGPHPHNQPVLPSPGPQPSLTPRVTSLNAASPYPS